MKRDTKLWAAQLVLYMLLGGLLSHGGIAAEDSLGLFLSILTTVLIIDLLGQARGAK